MHSSKTLVAAAALLGGAAAQTSISIYWGQNSYGSGTEPNEQQNLAYYCQSSDVDYIPMAFVTMINGEGGAPEVNFANAGNNCTTFSGTELLHCPQIGDDIKTCQSAGKKILLSIGGATYSEGGFSSSDAAVAGANLIWETFGPQQSGNSAPRPFDDAVVDGFDFDFEATANNIVPFANQLRTLMDGDSSKSYYLSAAPQCPYPDAYDGSFLQGEVAMDLVWVQFYNNYCESTNFQQGASSQQDFNFDQWDNWAKTVSKNPNVKVFLGVPAGPTAAGAGYESASDLANVIDYCKTFSSFGGVMMWDASQAWANQGFLSGVASALGRSTKKAREFFA